MGEGALRRSSRLGASGLVQTLASPSYRRLLLGNALWWQAMFMEMTATGWLVVDLTDSAWQVALVQFYRSAPVVFVGFFTGPLSHRFGRLALVRFSQIVTLATTLGIALLLAGDLLELWQLKIAAILLGVCWTVGWTARQYSTTSTGSPAGVTLCPLCISTPTNWISPPSVLEKVIGPNRAASGTSVSGSGYA